MSAFNTTPSRIGIRTPRSAVIRDDLPTSATTLPPPDRRGRHPTRPDDRRSDDGRDRCMDQVLPPLFEAVLALIHGGGERHAGRLELREQVVEIGAWHPLVAFRPDALLVDETALRRGRLPGTTMSG